MIVYIALLGVSVLLLAFSLSALGLDPVVASLIACAVGLGLYLFITPRHRG